MGSHVSCSWLTTRVHARVLGFKCMKRAGFEVEHESVYPRPEKLDGGDEEGCGGSGPENCGAVAYAGRQAWRFVEGPDDAEQHEQAEVEA